MDAAALAGAGLVKGKTVGIDATSLEANAALRTIVRRDTGENGQDFLTKWQPKGGDPKQTWRSVAARETYRAVDRRGVHGRVQRNRTSWRRGAI